MAAPAGNGVYVVTQYIPAVNVNAVQQGTYMCQTPYFMKRFIKGEPKALGTLQILIGIIQICLGGILCVYQALTGSVVIYSGVTFWASLFYIISGALSVSAEKNGTRGLVKGSLGMNIISIIFAGTEIIIASIDLGVNSPFHCDYHYELCVVHQGIVSVILILTLLEFCIAFSTSVFGCKSVCCCTSNSEENQAILAVPNNYAQHLGNPMGQAPGMPVPIGIPGAPGMPVYNGVAMAQSPPTAPEMTAPPPYFVKHPGVPM